MENYWVYLALVLYSAGTGSCGSIAELNPDEVDFFHKHLEQLDGRQILYQSLVDVLMGKVAGLEDELKELKDSQSDSNTDSASNESDEQKDLGAVYVRWGRTDCREGTTLVYEGYAAGSWFAHEGAAANYLCLTTEPTWSLYTDATEGYGSYIYGAEYQFSWKGLGNHNVPCAVCRAPRSSVMMVPGTKICLDGWTLEYGGYLSAGHYKHKAASEYVCLDGEPEGLRGGSDRNDDGKLFYFVQAVCGSLKCPNYVAGRELTCAVCTL